MDLLSTLPWGVLHPSLRWLRPRGVCTPKMEFSISPLGNSRNGNSVPQKKGFAISPCSVFAFFVLALSTLCLRTKKWVIPFHYLVFCLNSFPALMENFYFPSCHRCFLWTSLWHRAFSSLLRGVPTESSIPGVKSWQPAMGVKRTHMFLMQIQSDIGRRSLLGDRVYAFLRQNKCVTFEERRDRAWLSCVCSVRHCISLSCLYPFVKQCLLEETCAKPFYFG